MADSKIVLFDIPSNDNPPKAWSLNPWKIRLLLNYKKLDYTTEWLVYPDIKPRLQPHFPADHQSFTIPTVKMPDGTYIMNSKFIAEALEKAYPEPSIHLNSPYQQPMLDHLSNAHEALQSVYQPGVYNNVLSEGSKEYFHRTRSEAAGMPLEEFEKQGENGSPWDDAAPHFQKITQMLKENEGPFFMGEMLSYTDLIYGAYLIFMRRIGEHMFQRILEVSGDGEVHLRLFEAVRPFAEKND
ncbi:putative glutathione S-transferase [Xylariaceae sp. FL1272]|nr:putative glutathione S-transferase [Xylariaceae sp. FL1272]